MIKAEEIKTYWKTTCRYCDSPLGAPFLDLGSMSLANAFLEAQQEQAEEFRCPLSLSYCPHCGLVQLTHVVPPDLMFSNYLYVSSTTKTFRAHFAKYAKAVKKILPQKGSYLAVDIGSNDGLLLSCYEREGIRAIGIEPATNLSQEANRAELTTLNRYFDSVCVDQILQDYGPADVVSANNVFAHIDDVQEVCRNVQKLLYAQGIFVVEFPYLVTMLKQLLFDMIYHEHLSYISLTALNYLFEKQNFNIFDVIPVSSHGGSLRVFAQKKGAGYVESDVVKRMLSDEEKGDVSENTLRTFADRIKEFKEILVGMIREIKTNGKTIAGYGAPAKANTLINYCQFSCREIDYIVDDNTLKQGKRTPGAKIPIVSSAYLQAHPTDYVLIFAWNFAEEIIQKIKHLQKRGVKFIIPLPRPTIV